MQKIVFVEGDARSFENAVALEMQNLLSISSVKWLQFVLAVPQPS